MSGADHVSSGLGVDDVTPPLPGLTLRDYFAAKAMPEVMARLYSVEDTDEEQIDLDQRIAVCAYEIADAMFKARAA